MPFGERYQLILKAAGEKRERETAFRLFSPPRLATRSCSFFASVSPTSSRRFASLRFDLANSRNKVPARLHGNGQFFSRIYAKYFAVLSIVSPPRGLILLAPTHRCIHRLSRFLVLFVRVARSTNRARTSSSTRPRSVTMYRDDDDQRRSQSAHLSFRARPGKRRKPPRGFALLHDLTKRWPERRNREGIGTPRATSKTSK